MVVVLVEFADMDFSQDDPHDFYNRLFNEKGYNEGAGRAVWPTISATQSGDEYSASTSTAP